MFSMMIRTQDYDYDDDDDDSWWIKVHDESKFMMIHDDEGDDDDPHNDHDDGDTDDWCTTESIKTHSILGLCSGTYSVLGVGRWRGGRLQWYSCIFTLHRCGQGQRWLWQAKGLQKEERQEEGKIQEEGKVNIVKWQPWWKQRQQWQRWRELIFKLQLCFMIELVQHVLMFSLIFIVCLSMHVLPEAFLTNFNLFPMPSLKDLISPSQADTITYRSIFRIIER